VQTTQVYDWLPGAHMRLSSQVVCHERALTTPRPVTVPCVSQLGIPRAVVSLSFILRCMRLLIVGVHATIITTEKVSVAHNFIFGASTNRDLVKMRAPHVCL